MFLSFFVWKKTVLVSLRHIRSIYNTYFDSSYIKYTQSCNSGKTLSMFHGVIWEVASLFELGYCTYTFCESIREKTFDVSTKNAITHITWHKCRLVATLETTVDGEVGHWVAWEIRESQCLRFCRTVLVAAVNWYAARVKSWYVNLIYSSV